MVKIYRRLARIAFATLGLAFLTGVGFNAAAQNASSMPEGRTAANARHGGGFEFRHRLSTVDNPYCDITTYVVGDFAQQATSTVDANGKPVIAIDASILRNDEPYAHFLMAHECCHHTLGHVRLTSSSELGHLGPQPFYYIRPLLKTMELDADSCATRMLRLTKEPGAIDEAQAKMLEFGDAPTGAYYPTGVERATGIARAASGD